MSTTRERYLEWKNRCLLPQLPVELWAHIFSYLQINDLFSIRLVSRLFYSCINQHTSFWSSVIFNIDECSNYLVTSDLIRHVRSSNIDLFTKSDIYSHCTVYLKAQPSVNSTNKRRKRQLLKSHDDDDDQSSKKQLYLRCLSVHFESLRSFDQLQLEYLLRKRIRRLELSYECISNEPSLVFLLKLERLKHLKISFLHNITELNPFAIMLIRTIRDIIILLFKLKSLLGDCLCFGRPFSFHIISNTYLRAITDNFTHGLISVFATSFLFGWRRRTLLILAYIAGSFVDIDHFLEARSLSLHHALNLQQGRPFLHNSLLLLIINIFAFGIEHFLWRYHYIYYSAVFFIGWSTHHLRDAQRRGLTLLPFGETPPIDYYIPIMCFVLMTIKLFYMFGFSTQSESTIILRHSTCDRTILTNFLDQLHTLHYLDLASLQIIKTNNSNNEQLYIPSKVKIGSLNHTVLEFSSFHSHSSLRSLELIDINIKQLSNILNTCQSLQIVCLFFSIQQCSLSSIIKYFQQHQYSQVLIHLHLLSIDDNDEKYSLPSNILIIPTKESLCCFCYRNLM
ncbi:unnamed protein product [Adineta steineri]|uniref:Transmembrane protein 267 n=1 Tax=Adineta steineri TaxID=433720 RepID=A0A814DI03_9BILA|nr:unnamed protein product [Adineta steineri]